MFILLYCVHVDRFLQYLAHSRPILRKYSAQELLICPPHLHNAAALPCEKLISSFRLLHIDISSVVCGWLWKEPFIWCWDEDADLEMTELLQMLKVTITGSHTGSQVLTRNVCILILLATEIFPILSPMSN